MTDNKWTLYIHTNKINGKQYVGITSRPAHIRWGTNGNNYLRDNTYFGNAIKKYGWDAFEHEIIYDACLTEDDAKKLEKQYILELNTKRPNGYNLTDGGDGKSGYQITEEARENMIRAQQKRASEGRCQSMLGKNHTEETKEKIRQAKLNLTDEQRKNMSDSAKKIWSNEEFKKRRLKELQEAKSNTPYKYRPMGDRQKEILAQARTEKCSGKNNCKATQVWCIELELMFETIKEAGLYFNAKETTYKKIGDCCMGKRNTCMGYHWMYYEDYLNSTDEIISQILKKQGNTKMGNNGRAKKVFCIELNKQWDCAEEVALEFNVSGNKIRICCRNGTALKDNGFHFKYLD